MENIGTDIKIMIRCGIIDRAMLLTPAMSPELCAKLTDKISIPISSSVVSAAHEVVPLLYSDYRIKNGFIVPAGVFNIR